MQTKNLFSMSVLFLTKGFFTMVLQDIQRNSEFLTFAPFCGLFLRDKILLYRYVQKAFDESGVEHI